MTNLTPPPERDLDPARRQAIRSVLGTVDARRGAVVPLLAAAGVAAVVGAAIAVPKLGSEPPAAGTGGSGIPVTGQSSAGARTTASAPAKTTATRTSKTPDLSNWAPPTNPPKAAEQICKDLLTHIVEGAKVSQSAHVVTSMEGRWGTALILSDGKAWAGCDTSGYVHNHASLRKPELLRAPTANDNDAFAVSQYAQSKEWTASSTWYDYFWAAGLVPDGVARIAYTFPDGKTEAARIDGRYWLMQHAPDEPMKEGVAPTSQIKVTLSRSDGAVIRTFKLKWGDQTCAAITHGC
ncbi:MAG TPA: hypothetical protein VEK80_04155 [Kribbellaceae bacterium]|nr:hypothetical protein [Kribbellaceae bacterium]